MLKKEEGKGRGGGVENEEEGGLFKASAMNEERSERHRLWR